MGQVIKISTTDFRAIHLSIGGRLVPSDLLDEARGRALRMGAMEAQIAGTHDIGYRRAVNLCYRSSGQVKYGALVHRMRRMEINPNALSLTRQTASTPNLHTTDTTQSAAATSMEALATVQALRNEKSAGYLQDRGAFEMRVHQGEIVYLPAMEMVIVTQMPEIKFEYTGDFVYFPKRPLEGENMDIVS